MKAIVCLGNYAKKPYYFERFDISVYSMEELAFCLKENAFMLGTEIMSDGLLYFIKAECNVPELADKLYPLVHSAGALSTFVSYILEYVGLYDKEIIEQTVNTVKAGSGMSDYEKQKLRIDQLVQKNRFLPALECYDEMISQVEAQQEKGKNIKKLLADMWYHKGVIYAQLFLYGEAADCFSKAYALRKTAGVLKAWLFAKRMELPEKDYIALIADSPEYYDASLQIEKKLEAAQKEWTASLEYAGLENMREWRIRGELEKYSEESSLLVETLKKQYRSQ